MNHPSRRLYEIANTNGSIDVECERILWKRKIETGKPIWLQINEILRKGLIG